ncbi:hypothetical protein [Actinokineospora diospyrosa]|uniref:hypothetical protein n=1 Tax=Actinokineospora diospyrosa TaxID=103728 RepID=UPI0020A37D2D|nr:hypothetical protein [Actinokineospora diospyrosa]
MTGGESATPFLGVISFNWRAVDYLNAGGTFPRSKDTGCVDGGAIVSPGDVIVLPTAEETGADTLAARAFLTPGGVLLDDEAGAER